MESAIDETEVQQTSLQQNKPEMNTDLHTTAKASQSDASPFLPKLEQECLPTAAMPVHKDANCYNMNHKNRGKCIIFNHEKFDSPKFPEREGSAIDASRLETTFQYLNFDVKIHTDLTKNQITDVIEEVSQLDHTDNDCLCIIVLTHGLDDDRLVAKDTEYKFDELWKPFTADKCVTLAGKPKLFFIQACRGKKADRGVLLKNCMVVAVQQSGRLPFQKDTVLCYAIPTHADFLLAQSTVQGFSAWRDPLKGTWYIQCLCDVLDEYGTEMDLMSMLTITARKVATDFASVHVDDDLHNKKQIPSVTSMLTRLVYFPQKSVTNSGKSYCRLL
ncbi:caspase-1 [Solenopsis invicta]|uniref:caspase-1 n=1 Tax=Solenopsis invicta TaxID=13686 RepID=UPI00193CD4F6|nr:caspase-1 [Solenopsis invicta]